jgi:hypothetical protein
MKHPDLGSALLQLYPNADHLRDLRVVDLGDGEGPTLAYWDEAKLGPQPTADKIDKTAKEWQKGQADREKRGKLRDKLSSTEFIEAYFESKLGNEAPRQKPKKPSKISWTSCTSAALTPNQTLQFSKTAATKNYRPAKSNAPSKNTAKSPTSISTLPHTHSGMPSPPTAPKTAPSSWSNACSATKTSTPPPSTYTPAKPTTKKWWPDSGRL